MILMQIPLCKDHNLPPPEVKTLPNLDVKYIFRIQTKQILVRFKILTAASMKIVFCDVAPCSLVEINRRFRGAYCLHHQEDL
jgi:hypothetical protein